MKKIVSFKKELTFKTKVCEITSISLEHIIKKKDEDIVSGEFLINGEYKMTEGSINREKYEFILPFDLALNSNYDIDSVKLDIDNFYYEILNNEILKVNIDLLIEAEELEYIPETIKELPKENIFEKDNDERTSDELTMEQIRNVNMDEINIENEIENIKNSSIKFDNNTKVVENNIEKLNQNEEIVNNNININTNIFDNLNDNETYSTYYVYIVKEEDTIDKILEKYSITKEDLENYNNIENIKPFDKIIIPTNGK